MNLFNISNYEVHDEYSALSAPHKRHLERKALASKSAVVTPLAPVKPRRALVKRDIERIERNIADMRKLWSDKDMLSVYCSQHDIDVVNNFYTWSRTEKRMVKVDSAREAIAA